MCLFNKLLSESQVRLTYFNSKIFKLFQKMYSFKLIEVKGYDNKKVLYTYMEKLL